MPIDPSKPSTNTNGSPAPSDEYSLTVGADGPVVLHDAHLIDTLAHFNRENIPERKPHAKGSGAFGHLEVTALGVHQGILPAEGARNPHAGPILHSRR